MRARLSGAARFAVLAATVLFASIALLVGQEQAVEPIALNVGDIAPVTFIAPAAISVEDEADTEAKRQAAAAAVLDVYRVEPSAT